MNPSLYQINTRVWLQELGSALGRPATLDDVPDASLDQIAADGFDWVWLLGVWQTGDGRAPGLADPARVAAGVSRAPPRLHRRRRLRLALRHPRVRRAPRLRRRGRARRAFARRLADRGVRLMLDFVPNHTALDHPWARAHPEFFIPGGEDDLAREPQNYVRRRHRTAASASSRTAATRTSRAGPTPSSSTTGTAGSGEAMPATLAGHRRQCDGVRCDMAMLVLPDVIARTWGDRARPADGTAARRRAVLAGGHRARAPAPARLRVHGRGLLGPRVDAPAAGLRLHLRQAALRPPARAGRRRGARPPARGPRSTSAGPRASSRTTTSRGRRRPFRRAIRPRPPAVIAFLAAGPPLLPRGAAIGPAAPRLEAPGPPARSSRWTASSRPSTIALLACLRRPRGRATGTGRCSSASPAWDGNPTWERFVAFAGRARAGSS